MKKIEGKLEFLVHSNESSIYQKLFCAGQENEGNFSVYIRKKVVKSVLSFQKKKLEDGD